MSGVGPKSLFFLGLPDLSQLVCVTLSPQEEEQQEPRTNQIQTCRELLLLYSDILACPALDSITDVTAVMSVHFLQRGVLQAFAIRNRLQLDGPHTVFPGDLQCCLSYSLISRLAPSWNKAGLYLISGADFLTRRGTLSAVSLEMNTSGGRLSLSIEASAVRTPPPTLDELGLPAPVLQRFCSDPDFILDPSSTGGAVWCHVLPSMKKGQIISISRQLPRDGPFRTYGDLQNHWNRLYGYQLPDLQGGGVYCSVYFRPVGEKVFTYPLSCIRLQPVQRCPRGDLQGALARFLADSRERLQSVCGFPTRLTSKPSYPTAGLTTAASMQVLSSDQINLTTRPVLSQPAPSSRAAPPAWVPLSQQGGALPGSRSGNSLWHRPEDRSTSAHPSSSQNQHQSDHSRFVSSFFQHFQPASSLPPLPQPSPVPVNPPPKLVPIFRNNDPTRRLSVALLRVQKQQSGATEDKHRLTLPLPVGSQATPSSSSSSSSSAPLPPPPLIVPRFARRPKGRSAAVPQPSGQSRVTRISSLSPVFKAKAAIIIPPRTKPSRTSGTVRPERAADRWKAAGPESIVPRSIMKTSREAGPEGSTESEPRPPQRETAASRKTVGFDLKEKPNKSKVSVDDVEKMARSNQWSGLSGRSLLLWLRNRGIPVSSKLRKEQLMMKVMSCLAEA
ncbi:uncharacterized protein C18orf63-like isoform X2 [Gambusia affinis]|uniref:uncharacterized protein C18orf63-like isoform X2 n=1 Tax=Gambusia affinis TaxID=33528 RepID=UPI001CDC4A03|nr:uncharacterized protein C18orf63-like isoform X2 [Gambusia affinis]